MEFEAIFSCFGVSAVYCSSKSGSERCFEAGKKLPRIRRRGRESNECFRERSIIDFPSASYFGWALSIQQRVD